MFYEAVNMTDNALMARVGAGELAKLAVLFERHYRSLFRYFVSLNRDRELSEDLVQDVFFRMLKYRTSYDSAQSFTAWMYQIARRASLDRARKQRGKILLYAKGLPAQSALEFTTGILNRSKLLTAGVGQQTLRMQ